MSKGVHPFQWQMPNSEALYMYVLELFLLINAKCARVTASAITVEMSHLAMMGIRQRLTGTPQGCAENGKYLSLCTCCRIQMQPDGAVSC